MTTDPNMIRAEQFHEVGMILQRDASVVIDRWCRRAVLEQPQAQRVHKVVLRDELVNLLVAIGQGLAEYNADDTVQHHLVALEHGEQRWESGWSLSELVRDYQILRLVVVDYLEETIDRSLRSREVMAVSLAIDEALDASVGMYVKYREQHSRAQEAARLATERATATSLREAQRRKDEFLSTLAHELRNPLSPILHSVEVLRLIGPADPAVNQTRDVIERQVQHLARLVDDLADLTRISQGKLELRRQPIDLASVLAQAISSCTPLLNRRKHQLSLHMPTEPLRIEADPDRLLQIVSNLLNNAAKYTEPGGHIWLTAQSDGEKATIRVRDNGIGLPQDMLEDVFDMYRQVDHANVRAQGGLGIGLNLVRSLVAMHGGTVVAESDGLGLGSQFVVCLPRGNPEAYAVADTQLSPTSTPRRILIIEDNGDTRDLLRDLLILSGHKVYVASNAREGLALSAEHSPEIALIDIGLPDVNGYEVCREIRALPGGDRLLLVALTGYGQPEDRQHSLDVGFDAHLVKPVKLDELTRLVCKRK